MPNYIDLTTLDTSSGEYKMMLLDEATSRIRMAVREGKEDTAVEIFYRVIFERIAALNLRCQQAESRAAKAERNLDRVIRGEKI